MDNFVYYKPGRLVLQNSKMLFNDFVEWGLEWVLGSITLLYLAKEPNKLIIFTLNSWILKWWCLKLKVINVLLVDKFIHIWSF